jgi:uncharacterized protein YpuA (DUF1002 family)
METDKIKSLLAEQHRNTRHDAIDKINEIRDRWSKTHNFSICDNMFNEITGAIMNLKQREPEIKNNN